MHDLLNDLAYLARRFATPTAGPPTLDQIDYMKQREIEFIENWEIENNNDKAFRTAIDLMN